MSTRAEILITTKDGTQQKYYHHHDGYPWGVGFDLVERVMENPKRFEFYDLRSVLTQDYEKEELNVKHGDTEYFYEVIANDKGITITYKKRIFSEFVSEWGEPREIFYMKYFDDIKAYIPKYINIRG
jgi:hypothetical protein